jgi:CAAX prenyl protease-like protein
MNRPMLARVAPFALYLAFLAVEQGARAWSGDGFDPRWLYPGKVVVVAFALWVFRGEYRELLARPARRSLIVAILLGVLVFALWIHLDQGWMNLGGEAGYDPRTPDGGLDWALVAFRLAGASLVVPLMEELFWRSFLLRWIERQDFLSVPAAAVGPRAVIISSLLFGSEHSLWFAGILAGLAYAWLYRHYGNLWPAIAAHATTNLILGLWVLQTGAWRFW